MHLLSKQMCLPKHYIIHRFKTRTYTTNFLAPFPFHCSPIQQIVQFFTC